jgi:hypothetical protein
MNGDKLKLRRKKTNLAQPERQKFTASYRQKARKKWGKRAASIMGNGRYALLAWCHELTVTLWDYLAEAEIRKRVIDRTACGGQCRGAQGHEIVDLKTGA